MYDKAKYLFSGDSAVNIEFGNSISEESKQKNKSHGICN